jgi:hypothetical protein
MRMALLSLYLSVSACPSVIITSENNSWLLMILYMNVLQLDPYFLDVLYKVKDDSALCGGHVRVSPSVSI